MAVPSNTIFEVGYKYTINSQVCRNFVHFRPEEEVLGVTQRELAELILEQKASDPTGLLVADLLDVLAPNAELNEVSCQPVFPTRFRKFAIAFSSPGEGAADCDAQNLQVSIEKYAELSGRKYVGGLRVGAVPPGNYDNGLITGAAEDLYVDLAESILVQFQVNVLGIEYMMIPVIAHKAKVVVGGVEKWQYTGSDPVVGWKVQEQIRTQRTRTVGKGE